MNTDTIVPNESATRVPPEYAPAPPLPDTFREWMLQTYSEGNLSDLAIHGQSLCCEHSITYQHETIPLYNRYHDEMWARLWQAACDRTDEGVAEWDCLSILGDHSVAGFVGNHGDFQNLMVWWMADTTAADIMREREEV